jgi:hypothetical protein
MGSANEFNPKLLNMINGIAGFDQLVHETNPHAGEPEGNAYHYLIQQTNRTDYPYIIHGPYRSEARIKHHFSFDELENYREEKDS